MTDIVTVTQTDTVTGATTVIAVVDVGYSVAGPSAVPVSGGNMSGTLILNGSPPLAIPAGAGAGDYLSSDGSGNASWAYANFPNWLNVRSAQFGAHGDNPTHDDTTAIQAALNAAPSGGTVFVPYTSAGYLCGALTIPPGITFLFDAGAKLVAPSSLAANWLQTQTGVVHTGTAIIGGTFDATAVTSTSCTAVIHANGYTSCPGLLIYGNRIINAPQHGIFVGGESVHTLDKKWIIRNSIEEHGVAVTGFGIYADYGCNVEISSNYIYTAGVDDSIELGHSGPANLGGVNGHMTADRNVCVGGQLQFPHSDYAQITNNIVINNGIQNDTWPGNYVTITGNTIYNSTPNAGYAGINVSGDYFTVANNRVQVTTLGGIHSANTTGSKVVGNEIESLSAVGNVGAGISIDGGANNIIEGNVIRGANAATSGANGGFHYGLSCGSTGSLITGNMLLATVGTSIRDQPTASGNVYKDNNCSAVFTGTPSLAGTGAVFRNNTGVNPGTVTKTANYSVQPWDSTILMNASGSTTVTLPTAVGYAGQAFTIKNINTGTVTIATTSSQTIDGAAPGTLATQWQSLTVVSDGANWQSSSSIPGSGTAVTTTATQTLTNKRITKRVETLTDAATVTPASDSNDGGKLLTLSQATTIANPSGTPTAFQQYILRVTSASAQSFTWGGQFRGSTALPLPSATTGGGKTDYFGFQWDADSSTWDLIALSQGY